MGSRWKKLIDDYAEKVEQEVTTSRFTIPPICSLGLHNQMTPKHRIQQASIFHHPKTKYWPHLHIRKMNCKFKTNLLEKDRKNKKGYPIKDLKD
jgi:hypothetical protein